MTVRLLARHCVAASTCFARTIQPSSFHVPWKKHSFIPWLSKYSSLQQGRRLYRCTVPTCMASSDSHAELDPLGSIVANLHTCPTKLVVYVTGGGAQAIGTLLSVPGASNTVLDASVPYAASATIDLLGGLGCEPDSFSSKETAGKLAKRAYVRAAELTAPGEPIIGLSCTASLKTNRLKKGSHRFHIACQHSEGLSTYSVVLEHDARTRAEEEALCTSAIISVASFHSGVEASRYSVLIIEGSSPNKAFCVVFAWFDLPKKVLVAASIPEWPSFPGLSSNEKVETVFDGLGDPITALLEGRIRCVEFCGPPDARQTIVDAPRVHAVVLPGSFNPLHQGHINLLESSCRISNARRNGIFELCVRNPDKGAISRVEIAARLKPFEEQGLPVVLTDASRFTDKAKLFRGARFVLGHDTAVRVVMPKYYDNSEAQMSADFAVLTAAGCAFTVAGRLTANGEFRGLADIHIPDILRHVGVDFKGITEEQFRMDISSTEIRRSKLAEKHDQQD